jgi:16S rRNA (cytidine1402-2'-O)-methyltransferase
VNKAKVYLIPNLLGNEASTSFSFPEENKELIQNIRHFAVENLKDTRRFLVRMGLKPIIDESSFYSLNKHSTSEDLTPILQALREGHDVGIISDAGCPGIADPGALLVAAAHQNQFAVVPLIGPSSILMALIASGFSGQSFAFNGYLSREQAIRSKELRQLETKVLQQGQTQIFMETPYRNGALFSDLIQQLAPNTLLCIATNISLPTEFIRTQAVKDWKKFNPQKLHKQPSVFLIGR